MAITDELREYAKGTTGKSSFAIRIDLINIADRIDAAHERAVAAAHSNGITEYGSMVAREYVKLPVDADGVPYRIGDEVYSDHHEDGTVRGIQFYGIDNGSIRTLIAVKPHDWHTPMWWRDPKCYRRHAPTVEDVLDEFFGKANLPDGTQTRAEIIAEYAAKLRLAEEVDE